jgi:hypothetical protein
VPGATWSDAAKQARTLGEAYDAWLEATVLPPTPRTAIAKRCEEHFRRRKYAAPLAPLEGHPWNWFVMRERAAELMIKVAREDFLDVRTDRDGDQRFKTVWYKTKPSGDGLIIPDIDPSNGWHRQAFITRRSAIECPPRTNVVQNDKAKRRLHFFDHGCGIHDGAVAAFEKQAPATDITSEFIVEYAKGHPILQWASRRLLVAVSEVDLRDAISFDPNAMLGRHEAGASKAEQDARAAVARLALAQFQADRRWMIDLAAPELLFVTLVENRGEMMVVDAGPAVFDPFFDGAGARQLARRRLVLSNSLLDAARTAAMRQLNAMGNETLRRAIQAVRSAVPHRRFAAQADAHYLAAAAAAEIKVAAALDTALEFNRAALRGIELMATLSEQAWQMRLARLEGLDTSLAKVAKLKPPRFFWLVPKPPSA